MLRHQDDGGKVEQTRTCCREEEDICVQVGQPGFLNAESEVIDRVAFSDVDDVYHDHHGKGADPSNSQLWPGRPGIPFR